jgi:predicted phosphoribosyltransferase
LGAIAAGDVVVIDRSIQHSLLMTDAEVNKILETERKELVKNMIELSSGAHVDRYNSPHTVIVVDDGLASGVTVRAAIEAAECSIIHTLLSLLHLSARMMSRDMIKPLLMILFRSIVLDTCFNWQLV